MTLGLNKTDSCGSLPALARLQELVFLLPLDKGLGVAGGLAVQNGCVALVNSGVLRLHIKCYIHWEREREGNKEIVEVLVKMDLVVLESRDSFSDGISTVEIK